MPILPCQHNLYFVLRTGQTHNKANHPVSLAYTQVLGVCISPINGCVNGILPLGACGSACMSRCKNALTSCNPLIPLTPPAVPWLQLVQAWETTRMHSVVDLYFTNSCVNYAGRSLWALG